jgi:hypothetical protein
MFTSRALAWDGGREGLQDAPPRATCAALPVERQNGFLRVVPDTGGPIPETRWPTSACLRRLPRRRAAVAAGL